MRINIFFSILFRLYTPALDQRIPTAFCKRVRVWQPTMVNFLVRGTDHVAFETRPQCFLPSFFHLLITSDRTASHHIETAVLPSQMEMTRILETSRVASTAILLIKSCNPKTGNLHTIFHCLRTSFIRFYPTWVGVSRKTPRLPNDNKKAEGQTEILHNLPLGYILCKHRTLTSALLSASLLPQRSYLIFVFLISLIRN